MTSSLCHKIFSVVLIAIILSVSTAGVCHKAHAAAEHLCSQDVHADSRDVAPNSCPDGDHEEPDHCAASCYCSCHLPVISSMAGFSYNPVVTDHMPQQSFTSPQEIFLTLFVPPDNHA